MNTSFETGTVEANGLSFQYLAHGEGPLALLLHGFPDTAMTWRHLMPMLAAQGYRAVAPYMRGYAPSGAPDMGRLDGAELFLALGADANGLHQALGGDERAVLIGHDWGALATYSAALQGPRLWRRCVALAVPPLQLLAVRHSRYEQLKRSFYMWFFQMAVADDVVRANDFAFIRALWADWSPGYDATEDLAHLRRSLTAPDNLRAALGYYRAFFAPVSFSFDYGAAVGAIPPPLLYLHGESDGCIGLTDEDVAAAMVGGGPGTVAGMIPRSGHFLHLEQAETVGARIVDFVGPAGD